jgi:hypothetical protein
MPRAARVAEHTLGADKTSEGECEHPQKVVMVKRTSESHKGIEELVVQADNVYQLRGFDSLPLLRLRMPYARQNLQATQSMLLTASKRMLTAKNHGYHPPYTSENTERSGTAITPRN